MIKRSIILMMVTLSLFAVCLTANDVEIGQESHFEVRNVYFSGNRRIVNRDLQQTVFTKAGSYYDPHIVREDSRRIANLYQERGLVNVQVHYPEAIPVSEREIDVYFTIEENDPLLIEEFVLTGNSYISSSRVFQATGYRSEGEYDIADIDRLILQIVDFYAARGFFFTNVTLDSLVIQAVEEEVLTTRDYVATTAYIAIDEGEFGRFENYIFTGNEVTRESTLMRISGLDRMENFSLFNLQLAEENVRRKEYINDFRITPVNSRTLLMNVEEDKMTHFFGMLGYDSSQQQRDNRLTGFINLKLLNLYGTDRSLELEWNRLQTNRESIEFRYFESGPFRFPVAADLLLYRETVDSTYILTTIDTEMYYYDLRNKYGIYLGSDDIFPGSRRPMLVDKTSYKKIGLFWRYNSEDYYLNPTQGMSFNVRHYYIIHREGKDWVNKQASEFLWRSYFPLAFGQRGGGSSKPLVFMVSLNGKQIQNRNLLDYELYELGGLYSIRGFRENQFSGHRVLWSNLELRYLLTRRSRLFLFTDYGYVQTRDEVLKDLVGLGFGLRIDTRLGLIGVDYGFSYSEGSWMHPLDGMIHFGVETRF